MMTYWVSEEGPVCQSDPLPVARPTAVVVGWMGEACLATVQAAEAAGDVYRGAGVGVLRNNDWGTPEDRASDDPWALHTPEALWRSGPAWLPRDR